MFAKNADITNILSEKFKVIDNLKCCIGFDGFIDEIFRLVKCRNSTVEYSLFEKIEEFADHIKASAGRSADVEIISSEIKLGGNAPIMANAIAKMGIKTNCIGALGFPEIHNAYKQLTCDFVPLSIAEPAYTHAFEFQDGKIMFGNVSSLDNIDWQEVKTHIGLEKLIQIFDQSDLIGIVNWRYINNMKSILHGIIEEVFPSIKPEILFKKRLFFDIADPSGRSTEDLWEFLNMLRIFSGYVNVILGVNEREARAVYECILKRKDTVVRQKGETLRDLGIFIFNNLGISVLVIHTVTDAVAISANEICEVEGFFVDKPKISTGGGDNFNGGFCIGQMLELSLEQSLTIANATSSFYVSNGYSPNLNELLRFLSKNDIS